ncbi:MAG: 16S rRNA (guanine(966)-N(2))-methyltransferase RsmD [Smithella sp.]
MRVIAGKARGRQLLFPASSRERPTADSLRETLFNILGPLEGKNFLDLFAGSGSVGIEAASRGAIEVFFIEKDKKIAEVIKKNIASCNFEQICRIITRDAGAGLHDLFKSKCEFNIIFADPPYCRGLVKRTLQLLKENPVFVNETIVIIQHSTREDIELDLDNRSIIKDQRKYGDNALTFLKMERS